MACHHPMKAFWTGAYTESGKKDYIIAPGTAGNLLEVGHADKLHRRLTGSAPLVKIDGHVYLKDPIAIPCGHCIGCRLDKANEWKNRLVLESIDYPERTWFITLTYDDRHLPVSKEGEPYLNKKDLSAFMKRLRANTGRKFRFFACGEYGEHGKRPHYHMILFGDLAGFERTGINRYQVKDVNDAWWYGLTETSFAEPAAMAYVAGYCNKKAADPDWDSYSVKPFLLMSRRPAIGDNWRIRKDLEKIDFKIYGDFGSKNYAPLPRIFVRKSEGELWFTNYKARMEKAAREALPQNQARFGCKDEEDIGFIQEILAKNMLEKKETKL